MQWKTLEAARIALIRDGWTPTTAYWFTKRAYGQTLQVELDRQGDHLVPIEHPPIDDDLFALVGM
jgi:hypothetical protein